MTSSPRKVMFILPTLSSGGAERVLITLMNEIDRQRFQPEFISLRRNGPLKSLIKDDVTIHAIGSYKKIIFGFLPLLKKMREEKPDIIVTTMAKMNFLVLMMKPFLPKKTRIIIREAITPSYVFETHKLGWLAKLFYKFLYPWADAVISPAQRIIDEFETILDADISRHRLLYNPVNIALTRSQALPKIEDKESRQNTVHFICAGRLHPQKGFDQLIEALPYFKSSYNWHLSILGGGSEHNSLLHLAEKHNLQDKISFPGYTKFPWPQIAAADFFLLPSRYEGLPNVVLESLSVGTPVIATSTSGGIQEIKNRAYKGTLEVVNTMPEFIDEMKKIKPNPTEDYRESLLPDEFLTETAVTKFMNILDGKDDSDTGNELKPDLKLVS